MKNVWEGVGVDLGDRWEASAGCLAEQMERRLGGGFHLLRHEKRDELTRSPSCDVLEPGAGSYQQEPVLHISSQPGI